MKSKSIKSLFNTFEKHFEPTCIIISVSLMTLIILAQIVLRIFDASMPQAEEIARYLFVWAIYLSISFAIRDDRHIKIVFLIDKLPQTARIFAYNCADIVFIFYSITVVIVGYLVVERSLALGQIAPATEMPVAVLYMSVVVGSLLNVFRLSTRIIERIKQQNANQPAGINL